MQCAADVILKLFCIILWFSGCHRRDCYYLLRLLVTWANITLFSLCIVTTSRMTLFTTFFCAIGNNTLIAVHFIKDVISSPATLWPSTIRFGRAGLVWSCTGGCGGGKKDRYHKYHLNLDFFCCTIMNEAWVCLHVSVFLQAVESKHVV